MNCGIVCQGNLGYKTYGLNSVYYGVESPPAGAGSPYNNESQISEA